MDVFASDLRDIGWSVMSAGSRMIIQETLHLDLLDFCTMYNID